MTKSIAEKENKPVRWFPFLIGGAIGLFLLLVSLVFLPVEWSGAKTRLLLWKAGARPVLWEKHRGFTLDRCGGKAPEECACVWMFHGLGDSLSTWRAAFSDKNSFGNLPLRLYAIDLPAHGGSLKRKNPEEYRVRVTAHELNTEIAKVAECKKNILIGNSFGGWVATRMALDAPEQYSQMILLAPSGIAKVQPPRDGMIEDVFSTPTIEGLKEFQKRAYFKPRMLPDSEWRGAVKRVKESSTAEVRKAQMPEDSLDEDLVKLTVPTTVIWGDADRVIPRNEVDLFVEKSHSIKFLSIPECGHLPQRECPKKVFPMIQNVLNGVVPSAS